MKSPRALLGIPFLSVNENLYVFGVIKESDPSPPGQFLLPSWKFWTLVSLNGSHSTCPCKSHIYNHPAPRPLALLSHTELQQPHQLKAQHAPSTESDVLQHYQCPLRLPCRVHLFIFILRMRKLRLGEVRRLPRLFGWSW